MEKLYQLHLSDEISKEGCSAPSQPARLRHAPSSLRLRLPTAQAQLDALRIHRLSHESVVADARHLYKRWPSLSESEKRTIIEAITKKITVGTDTVEIELHYAPDQPPGEEGEGPEEEGEGDENHAPSAGYPASRNSEKKGTQRSAKLQAFGFVRGWM